MLNKNLLKAEWVKNGYTQNDVAKILGVTPKTLCTKLKKGSFGLDEAEILIKKLNIENPADIFFAV